MATSLLADDELRLIASTARNLRITQLELSDADSRVRESQLEEHVKQALSNVPMNDRQAFLEALSDLFPTWEDPGVPAEAAPQVEQDPVALLQAVLKAGSAWPEAHRREVVQRLQSAWGLKSAAVSAVLDTDGSGTAKTAALVKTRMGLAPTDPIDLSRALEAFVLLSEFAQVLEALGNKVWRNVNPAAATRANPIQKILANHIKGGSTTAAQDLLELRGLLAAIIGAVPDICRHFHSDYLSRFSPEEIEEVVRLEGGSAFVGTETKCWRKYTKMATDLDEQRLKAQLSQLMISLVEPYLKNKAR